MSQEKGFSVVEVLVTIFVLAILASGVWVWQNRSLPMPSGMSEKSETELLAKRKADLQKITTALQKYYEQNGSYPHPNNLETALVPLFLNELPKDPATKQPYSYVASTNFQSFSLSFNYKEGGITKVYKQTEKGIEIKEIGRERTDEEIKELKRTVGADSQRRSNVGTIATALEVFYTDHYQYPLSLEDLPEELLREIPTDPITNNQYEYEVTREGHGYKIQAKLSDGSIYQISEGGIQITTVPTPAVEPTILPTVIEPEVSYKTNSLVKKGNLYLLRLGTKFYQEAQYPTQISEEVMVSGHPQEFITLYEIPPFDYSRRADAFIYFDTDKDANYLAVSYEHSSDVYDIRVSVMKREGNSFTIKKELLGSDPMFGGMYPRVDHVEDGKAIVTLADCLYCEPSTIKTVTL